MYLQTVESYLRYIFKHKLTQAQYLFLYLLCTKKLSVIKEYKIHYPSEDNTMLGKAMLQDLINKGFVIVHGDPNDANSYEVTEKFRKLVLQDSMEAADEIWKIYPGFATIEGRETPLTAMDKYRFAQIYVERINYSYEEHQEILKDIEYGRLMGLIRMKIQNFVESQAWEKIRERRLKDTSVAHSNEL